MKPLKWSCVHQDGCRYINRCMAEQECCEGRRLNPKKPWTAEEVARAYKVPLDRVVDKVLAHKPKPKSKPARKRARRATKIASAK